jgi:hypothetical protein
MNEESTKSNKAVANSLAGKYSAEFGNLSPKVREFIVALRNRGLNEKERFRLLNLIERFYPHGRRPLLAGDLIVYRIFNLAELFKITTNIDLEAIRAELKTVKDCEGEDLPDDFVCVVPRPAELADNPVQLSHRTALTPQQRDAFYDVLFGLAASLNSASRTGYTIDERQEAAKIRDYFASLRIRNRPRVVNNGSDQESERFINELRQVLLDAVANVLVNDKSAA